MVSSDSSESDSQSLKLLVRIDELNQNNLSSHAKKTPIAKNVSNAPQGFRFNGDDVKKTTPQSIMKKHLSSTSTDPPSRRDNNWMLDPWEVHQEEACTNIEFPLAFPVRALPPSKMDTRRARTRKRSSDTIILNRGVILNVNEVANRRQSTFTSFIDPDPTCSNAGGADKESSTDDSSSTKSIVKNQAPQPFDAASISCFNSLSSMLFSSHEDEILDNFNDKDTYRHAPNDASPSKSLKTNLIGTSEEPELLKSSSRIDNVEIEAMRNIISRQYGRPLTTDTLKALHQSLMMNTSDQYLVGNASDRISQLNTQNVDYDVDKEIERKSRSRRPKPNNILNRRVSNVTGAVSHLDPSIFQASPQSYYKNPLSKKHMQAAFCNDSLDGTNHSKKVKNGIRPLDSAFGKETERERKMKSNINSRASESAEERDRNQQIENHIDFDISSPNEECDEKKTYTLSSFVGFPRRKDYAPRSLSKKPTELLPSKLMHPQTHEIKVTRQIYKKNIRTEIKQKVTNSSVVDRKILKTLPSDNTNVGKICSGVKSYNTIARRRRKKNRRETNQMWEV